MEPNPIFDDALRVLGWSLVGIGTLCIVLGFALGKIF